MTPRHAVAIVVWVCLAVAWWCVGPALDLGGRGVVAHWQDAMAQQRSPRDPVTELFSRNRSRSTPDSQQMLGETPRPDAETNRLYGEYVGRFIDPQNTLDVVINRPRVMLLRQTPVRIQLPSEEVVSYQLLSDREISLTGRKVGSTLMNMWFADPEDPTKQTVLSYVVRVFPDPEAKVRLERSFKQLEGEINRAFPDSDIRVMLVGDAVVVRGQAIDLEEADLIIEVVELNTANVFRSAQIPVEGARATPRQPAAQPSGGANTIPIPGLDQYDGASNLEGIAEGGIVSRVVNLIRVPGEPQVMLRVIVAEVNRSAARSIGLNFSVADDGDPLSFFQNLTGAVTGNLPMILDNGQVDLALQALRNLNLAKSLAEPNLVTLNGQAASFTAGGSFPVPVVSGGSSAGLQGVSFADFGISVDFTPQITQRDRIRLEIDATFSTRDESIGIDGVAGLQSREVSTKVDLRAGQTLAVAGLIQQNFGSSSDRIPGIGDLPIIGNLLGGSRTTMDEQELIMLVNVELVHPLEPEEVGKLPGDDMFEPDDLEFYLLGRLESHNRKDARSPARTDWDRMFLERETQTLRRTPLRAGSTIGPRVVMPVDPDDRKRFRQLENTYIIGPTGHSDGPRD